MFRQWLPALGFASVVVAGLTLTAGQAWGWNVLRHENARLRASLAAQPAAEDPAEARRSAGLAREAESLRRNAQDLERLRQEHKTLSASVSDLPALRQRNRQLLAQAAAAASLQDQNSLALALTNQLEKVSSIRCVNNLKQLALAARVWSQDNDHRFPSDFSSMSNELSTAKTLFCSADTAHRLPEPSWTWQEMQPGRVSYELLAPGASDRSKSPYAVLFRCPVHGQVALTDGSVQKIRNPETGVDPLVQSNGLTYIVQ